MRPGRGGSSRIVEVEQRAGLTANELTQRGRKLVGIARTLMNLPQLVCREGSGDLAPSQRCLRHRAVAATLAKRPFRKP